MTDTPLLTVRNVWKEYGDKVVLERIGIDIAEGSFCSVVGASGCGKSTFLRLLLGQETPSRGSIYMDGSPLAPEPDASRGIVFQRYSVFPHLSVLDNVVLGLEFRGSPFLGKLFGAQRRDAEQQARRVLDRVGLSGVLQAHPAALSGGMQQRLAIAQALVMKPRILLLDEPFGALDPGTRADMHKLITELWKETHMTVFMVTHDLKEGFALGTRLLVFDKVRVDAQAPDAFGATITYDLPLDRDTAKRLAADPEHSLKLNQEAV